MATLFIQKKLITFQSVFCFLLYFLSLVQSTKIPKLINTTCHCTPYYALCLQTLLEDPAAVSAPNVAALGLVIVEAIATHASQTLNRIRDLMRQGSPVALANCRDRYDAIVKADVAMAKDAFKLGDPKFAEYGANDAVVEADSCERGLRDGEQKSGGTKTVLSWENKRMCDLARLAASIAKLLL